MLFSSIYFLFYFLPITILLYRLVPEKAKNYLLLIASLIFYSWGEPVYVFLMIISAFFNYSMAKDIVKKPSNAKATLIFACVVNLLILGFFKYYGFLLDTISAIFHADIQYTPLPLPIGISFYTFQAMSYIIDVYRGDAKEQKNPFKFALYLSLFPQLIAGPIVKYKDVALQLENRTSDAFSMGKGAERFIIGLGKKVILANNFGAIYVSITALDSSSTSVMSHWVAILAYTLQIYFDFSGYSDMAIGLGKMFGFDFLENFNYPYISKSITEFWRRWHISLSTWFKEYLYIPLGGNKVKPSRHILNILIVWSLTGLWHGASWNFVAWGLYYGILLIIEKYLIGKYIKKLPVFVQHMYAMLIVMIGWVFFSSETLTDALHFIGNMFCIGDIRFANSQFFYILKNNFLLIAAGIIFSGPAAGTKYRKLSEKYGGIAIAVLLFILVISVSYLIFSSYNPFLYFRF